MKRIIYLAVIALTGFGGFAALAEEHGAEKTDKLRQEGTAAKAEDVKSGTSEDQRTPQVGDEAVGEDKKTLEANEEKAYNQKKTGADSQKIGAAGERTDVQQRRAKLRDVSGEIIKIKEVKSKGTGEANQVVMIKTTKADQRLIIDLGPVSQSKELSLKIGDKIDSQGPVVVAGGRPLQVASKVKSADKTITIERTAPKEHSSKRQ